MDNVICPEHMDVGTRNRRLYETLKGMGLYVDPIPDKSDPTRIAYMVVSSGLPFAAETLQSAAENPTIASIAAAMQGAKVGDVVGPAECCRENVIYLPTIR